MSLIRRPGFQNVVPARKGEWGADRMATEHFPPEEIDEVYNDPEPGERDLVPAIRNRHGEALLDGATWQALRGSDMELEGREKRPSTAIHPRAIHRVVEAVRLDMELRRDREAMDDELRRCQKVLADTRRGLRRHA